VGRDGDSDKEDSAMNDGDWMDDFVDFRKPIEDTVVEITGI
jgi:hypothetical protein